MPLPPAWRELARARFPQLPEDCGASINPGVFFDPSHRDWSRRGTTKDQRRIEEYIDRFDLGSKRILHVGVGNSGLAKRFRGRFREVVGTTVDQPEVDWGSGLGIPGYRVLLQNKYANTADLLPGRFDFIVDNNPTSACCCLRHLATLFELYREKLEDGGQVVTDQLGLSWIPENGIPRFSFDFDDLASVAAVSGLSAHRVNRHIYVLACGPLPSASKVALARHRVRLAASLPRRAAGLIFKTMRRILRLVRRPKH